MKKYEFLCGGDHGAWETYVTVNLTEDEESLLKEYASDDRNEMLYWEEPMDKIYEKVLKELEKQCDDELDANSLVVWVPFGLKEI